MVDTSSRCACNEAGVPSAGAERPALRRTPIPFGNRLELFIGTAVGAITFSGSVIAFGKLAGKYKFRLFQGAPVSFKGQHLLNLVLAIAMVALGVPIYSAIAVALGVFGSDPLATDAHRKVRPTYLYLYMLLSGLYVYALFAPRWWQSLIFMVLSTLLALALWQKARDQLPYLLDPAARPPARVSTADGLIAAMLFFVLQGAAVVGEMILRRRRRRPRLPRALAIALHIAWLTVTGPLFFAPLTEIFVGW